MVKTISRKKADVIVAAGEGWFEYRAVAGDWEGKRHLTLAAAQATADREGGKVETLLASKVAAHTIVADPTGMCRMTTAMIPTLLLQVVRG